MPDLTALLSSSIAVAALLLGAYFVFRKEGREESVASAHRLNKIEAEIANIIARQQGFQGEIENVADHARRERQAIVENSTRDHNVLREMIKDVPTMRDLVYRMVERLENTKESMAKLDVKMDRIVEILTHK